MEMQMTKNALFHVGVKALILNENREVLLVKSGRKKPKVLKQDFVFWDFPGGKAKMNEDLESALVREVKEETGIEVRIINIFGAVKSNFRDKKIKNLFLLLAVYRCGIPKGKKFRLGWEHSEWRWVPISEAKKLLSLKYPESFVRKIDTLK